MVPGSSKQEMEFWMTAAEPNSFCVETEEGVTHRRNRNFIKPRQVPQMDATENDYSHNLGCSGNIPNSLENVSGSGNSTPQEASSIPTAEMPSPAKKTNSTPVKSETPRLPEVPKGFHQLG